MFSSQRNENARDDRGFKQPESACAQHGMRPAKLQRPANIRLCRHSKRNKSRLGRKIETKAPPQLPAWSRGMNEYATIPTFHMLRNSLILDLYKERILASHSCICFMSIMTDILSWYRGCLCWINCVGCFKTNKQTSKTTSFLLVRARCASYASVNFSQFEETFAGCHWLSAFL